MKLIFTVSLCLCLSSAISLAEDPKPADAAKLEQAELKLLRQTVERQNKQIEELKAQIKELRALVPASTVPQAEAASPVVLPPASAETKDAEVNPVRKVYFLRLDAGDKAADEIRRAVDELKPDQMFYVATPNEGKLHPFFNLWADASKYYKDKLKKELPNYGRVSYDDPAATLVAAIRFQPDTLWIVGPVMLTDEEALIKAVLKARGSSKLRINTTSAFMHMGAKPQHYHLLWRLAHETGGVYINAKGEVLDETPLPVDVKTEKPPEKPKPSILKP